MSRFVFSKPGSLTPFGKRATLLRVGGQLMREVEFGKALREERGLNGRVRRRHSKLVEPEIVEILSDFRKSITVQQAEAAVASGKASVIVNAAAANELEAELVASISQHLEAALADGVGIGLRFAPAALGAVPVTIATEAAVAHVMAQGASAVLGITQATQAGIQEVLALGLRDLVSPVDVAEWVGDLAGLTPRQVRAVHNFRAATTARFVPTPAALTPEVQRVIDEEVKRYQQRLLLDRGRTIAETEIQAAVTQGEAAFWDEAIRSGEADEADVFKTWRTVRDRKVCVICEPLHGQTIRVKSMFVTMAGARKGPPAHPRCRCFLQYGELVGGRAPARPDRGMQVVRHQQADRLLDPATVREDLQIARLRNDRFGSRLGRTRPGSRAEANIHGAIGTNAVTIQSLEARLRDLGEVA